MITPELQQLAAKQHSGESITVPDEQGVTLEGQEEEVDVAAIAAMRDQLGDEVLTDEEYQLLQAAEHRQPGAQASDHYANLAEHVDDGALQKIGQQVLTWVQWDEESRAEWYETEKSGIRALGVSPNVDGGAQFDGASTVVHPVLSEAIVQFSARALEQLWPAGGPVKTAIMGAIDSQREQQAKRVEQFMNYQYTQEMPGAFEQTDKLLIRLPLSGSCFVKPFYDPVDGIQRGMVEPADFIVPYRANDLRTAPRYTERILITPNDLRKRQVAGMYRDITLMAPNEDAQGDSEREVVIDEIRAAEGRAESDRSADDDRHTLFECYCDLDLPGFEDAAEDGEPTGIALPYIVTVDSDSQKVLSIYRNWKPKDPKKRRIVYHIHYRFMPGYGFYGYGLLHWIGGLTNAATGALRALLDAAQFANLPGGFRAKDAAMQNGTARIPPGEWKEVDCEAADLAKAFFPLPYKEPSAVLFQLLGYLENLGRRFAGTTELMVGESNQNTPVGTTLARIEQGGKVFSSIQKRLHEAAKQEYQLVAWLDSLWLPDEYPYAVEGEDRKAFRADFDSRIDVIPVSDPNYVSNTQRYFMSQALLELAGHAPELYDLREIHRRALESLRIDNINAVMPDRDAVVKRRDPVTENALVGVGQPIRAFVEQAHEAHIAVHQMALAMLPKNHPAAGALDAHIREHLSLAYMARMAQATGIPFAMPDDEAPELPPEVENEVAMRSAQAAQQMQPEPPPDPQLVAVERDQARKDQIAERDATRKDTEVAADIRRDDAEALADQSRKDAAAAAEQRRESVPVVARQPW